jgi:F-type H+-transporting ATPase subunit alpha
MEAKHPTVLPDIITKKVLDDDLKARMNTALAEFKKKFVHDPAKGGASAKEAAEDEGGDEEEAPKPAKAKSGKKGK